MNHKAFAEGYLERYSQLIKLADWRDTVGNMLPGFVKDWVKPAPNSAMIKNMTPAPYTGQPGGTTGGVPSSLYPDNPVYEANQPQVISPEYAKYMGAPEVAKHQGVDVSTIINRDLKGQNLPGLEMYREQEMQKQRDQLGIQGNGSAAGRGPAPGAEVGGDVDNTDYRKLYQGMARDLRNKARNTGRYGAPR